MRAKDEELERTMQQKVALTSIFENDLLQMTDKMINAQSSSMPSRGGGASPAVNV